MHLVQTWPLSSCRGGVVGLLATGQLQLRGRGWDHGLVGHSACRRGQDPHPDQTVALEHGGRRPLHLHGAYVFSRHPGLCFLYVAGKRLHFKSHMVLRSSVLPSGARPGRVLQRRRPQVSATHPDGRHGLDSLRAADGSNGPQILRSHKVNCKQTKGVPSLESSTRNFKRLRLTVMRGQRGEKTPCLCVRVVVCAFFCSFKLWMPHQVSQV